MTQRSSRLGSAVRQQVESLFTTHLRHSMPQVGLGEAVAALVFRHQIQARLVAGGGPPAKSTPKISAPIAASRRQRVRRAGSARLALQNAALAAGYPSPQSRPNVDSLLGKSSRSEEKNTTWSRPALLAAYIAKSALCINDWVVGASCGELLTPMLAETETECS